MIGRQKELIERTDAALGVPVTYSRIVADLQKLGVQDGEVRLVHSSLSSVGWICGGAETLSRALIEVLGFRGTLVIGRVGLAECRLMLQSALVDFATGWLSRNRSRGGEP